MKRLLAMGAFALVLAAAGGAGGLVPRDEIVLADFEGTAYGAWKVTGEAFGPGPAQGTLRDQMAVSGYLGRGLVNTYYGGDGTTGTLTSPPFTIARRYVNFLVGGGGWPGETCINLLVDGQVVRTAAGPNTQPGGSERLSWHSWDVADLEGKTAAIEIVDRATGGWGHINVDHITMNDEPEREEVRTTPLYGETYRPQFHFTPRVGWTNDPNGLVFYKGEYHLFFQHNPFGTEWGNMTWGHAVSRDLVHWTQMEDALSPDAMGTMFSGSAVVDHQNTAGLQKGPEKTLVAFYTAAGNTSDASRGKRFTQCLAYSNDRGRTWTKLPSNPVVPHIEAENRDPKVVWHAPTRRWIMALFLDREDFTLLSSPDMKTWTRLQTLTMPGSAECPDFFEMPVEGERGVTRWVFTGANGRYLVGSFDGSEFTPEQKPAPADHGANYYAVQTYSDIPAADGRRIQIAWMNGGQYPGMPFNQQMSFPCALKLHRTAEGFRLTRYPVREIDRLAGRSTRIGTGRLEGERALKGAGSDLLDVDVTIELGGADEVGLRLRDAAISYDTVSRTLTVLGRSAPLEPENGRVRIRALLDRTSLEVFGNGGRASLTTFFLPRGKSQGGAIFARGGHARVVSGRVRALRSAWPQAE